MKKQVLLIIISIYFITGVYGQNKINICYYNNSQISSTPIVNGKFTVTIPINLLTHTIQINSNDLEEYALFLLEVKEKYEEWTQIAIKNKVGKMSKSMDIKFSPIYIHKNECTVTTSFGASPDTQRQFYDADIMAYYVHFKYEDAPPSNDIPPLFGIMWELSSSNEFEELVSIIRSIKPMLIDIETKKENDEKLFK